MPHCSRRSTHWKRSCDGRSRQGVKPEGTPCNSPGERLAKKSTARSGRPNEALCTCRACRGVGAIPRTRPFENRGVLTGYAGTVRRAPVETPKNGEPGQVASAGQWNENPSPGGMAGEGRKRGVCVRGGGFP
jgi:hypothetical protein